MKETSITIRLPESTKQKAAEDAKRRDLSMSAWIRKLIMRAK